MTDFAVALGNNNYMYMYIMNYPTFPISIIVVIIQYTMYT